MRAEEKLSEECAIFGVSLTTREAVGLTYNGLLALQHRGQEGAGIATTHNGNITNAAELRLRLKEYGLIAVRDPHGFRPLCIGRSRAGYAVACKTRKDIFERADMGGERQKAPERTVKR